MVVAVAESDVIMPEDSLSCGTCKWKRLSESSMSSQKKRKNKKQKKAEEDVTVNFSGKRNFKDPRLGWADRYRQMMKDDAKRAEKRNKLVRKRMKKMKIKRLELKKAKKEMKKAKKEMIREKAAKKRNSKYGEGVTGFKKGECRTERDWKKVMKRYDSDEEVKEDKAIWERTLKRFEENEVHTLRTLDMKCAKAALRRYNKKHATDYELVETLGTYYGISDGFWYHCNFKAQRKSGSAPSPKLFFAELVQGRKNYVRFCAKIDDCGYTVRGCQHCPDFIIHPVNKCKFGCVKK